jgi:hypothetical protein
MLDRRAATLNTVSPLARQLRSDNHAVAAVPDSHPDCRWPHRDCRATGDFVIMPGEGRPGFIWRTTEVTIKPLSEVDEAFAWDEGEGNRTRDWWLDAHRRYFRPASDA